MDAESVKQLKHILEQYPRMHGYYLLSLVQLSSRWRDEEETSLTTAFEALDDHPWKPPEMRPDFQSWVDYEVDEAEAHTHVVAALVGGREVGHTRDTIPRMEAAAIWERFRNLFRADARFFTGIGLGDSAYAFQRGAVIVDEYKAGCLCVIEDD
ncbi:hypothetical protein JXQ70_17570 [bacterium]|nr:hypothetical protein [bacterium]